MSRYLTYTPWPADFNNTRMCFETALVLAYITRRKLVLPAYRREHEPMVENGQFRPLHPGECFELERLDDLIHHGPVTAGGLELHVGPPGTEVFCYPRISSGDRRREFAAGRQHFVELTPEMEDCPVLHLVASLEHFYAFLFLEDDSLSYASKRLVRDQLSLKGSIVAAAAQASAFLGDYCALHVRRNDFLELYPQQIIPASRILGNLLQRVPAGCCLYIASDEKDRRFFDDLRPHYDIRFVEELDVPPMPPASLASVEQLICAQAKLFVGTRLSSFSGYVTRLRGYRNAADQGSYFTDGLPGSEMDTAGAPMYSWTNWLRARHPI